MKRHSATLSLEFAFSYFDRMSQAERIFQALDSCQKDSHLSFTVFSPISAVVAFSVLMILARRRRSRSFPDNSGLISCGLMAGVFIVACISIVFQDKHIGDDATGFYSSLCYIQAIGFQFFRTAFIWHWILTMITLYFTIVVKTPINEIRKKSHWYYGTLGSITLMATIIPAIFGKYGEVPHGEFCYITGAPAWRIVFAYSHLVVGIVIFLLFAYPVVKALRDFEVLQDIFWQQLIQAVFLFVIYTLSILLTINTMLLEMWSGAFDSTYIGATMYTYCVLNGNLLPLAGIVIGLIHLISYSSVVKCFTKEKETVDEIEPQVKSKSFISALSFASLKRYLSFRRQETRRTDNSSEYVQLQTPKPTERLGCTAVSIPIESQQRRAHFQARHARDELEEIDSSMYSDRSDDTCVDILPSVD